MGPRANLATIPNPFKAAFPIAFNPNAAMIVSSSSFLSSDVFVAEALPEYFLPVMASINSLCLRNLSDSLSSAKLFSLSF